MTYHFMYVDCSQLENMQVSTTNGSCYRHHKTLLVQGNNSGCCDSGYFDLRGN